MSKARYHQSLKHFTSMCIVLEAAQYLLSTLGDVTYLLKSLFCYLHTKKKKAKKESSKELYGELIVTISNPVAMFLMKLFWSFKALNAHSHDQGQCFMKC